MTTLPEAVASAQAALLGGKLALAAAWAEVAMRAEEQHAGAREVFAKVADLCGRPDVASRYRGTGSAGSGSSSIGSSSIGSTPGEPSPFQIGGAGEPVWDRSGRYLLIRGWGEGFFSDVDHVLGACLLAEVTGRTPVVHWGAESRFSDNAAANAWEEFFYQVSARSAADVAGAVGGAGPEGVFPRKWNAANLLAPPLNRREGQGSRTSHLDLMSAGAMRATVAVSDYHIPVASVARWLPVWHPMFGRSVLEIYRDLCGRYLRVREGVAKEAEVYFGSQVRRPMEKIPTIAVHHRGSDKYVECPPAEEAQRQYFDVLADLIKGRPELRIFLMTDSTGALGEYRKRFGKRIVAAPCARAAGDVGVHYAPAKSRRLLGVEVLRDVLVAVRCDFFLGLGFSNVACMVAHLKAWNPGECRLLGPMMQMGANPLLYMD